MAISAVSAVAVGTSAYSAYSDDKRADEAQSTANTQAATAASLDQEALDFQKERYASWESVYGELESNLGNYYGNLNSDDFRLQAYEAEKQQYQQVLASIKEQFAQSNTSGSAAEQLALARASITTGQANATIDRDAEASVNNQKLSFLNLGLAKESQIASSVGGTLGSQAKTSRTQSSANQSLADEYKSSRNDSIGSLLSTGVDSYKSYSSAG